MHKIKEMLMDELYEYEEKAKKMANGKISSGDLETIHKLTDTIKNIDKIEMLESGDEFSGDTDFMGEGRIHGISYARGRHGPAKRDRMGRYSREDGDDRGSSYRRRYSYDGGKEHIMEFVDEMIERAENDKEREEYRRVKRQLEMI